MFTAIALVCMVSTGECRALTNPTFLPTEKQCLASLIELKQLVSTDNNYEVEDATCIKWLKSSSAL